MIIISGYTYNTKYEEEIKDLESDLKRFNLPYWLYGYDSRGNWTKNTMVKAELVQRALMEYPEDDVIWIDADAVILKEPTFFHTLRDKNFDICCHYLKTRYNPNELLSGTIIFRNVPIVRKLVDDWVAVKDENWDQKILQELVDGKYKLKLNKLALPPEYIKIRPRTMPNARNMKNAVIGHKQLSREQRRIIK